MAINCRNIDMLQMERLHIFFIVLPSFIGKQKQTFSTIMAQANYCVQRACGKISEMESRVALQVRSGSTNDFFETWLRKIIVQNTEQAASENMSTISQYL